MDPKIEKMHLSSRKNVLKGRINIKQKEPEVSVI